MFSFLFKVNDTYIELKSRSYDAGLKKCADFCKDMDPLIILDDFCGYIELNNANITDQKDIKSYNDLIYLLGYSPKYYL